MKRTLIDINIYIEKTRLIFSLFGCLPRTGSNIELIEYMAVYLHHA